MFPVKNCVSKQVFSDARSDRAEISKFDEKNTTKISKALRERVFTQFFDQIFVLTKGNWAQLYIFCKKKLNCRF